MLNEILGLLVNYVKNTVQNAVIETGFLVDDIKSVVTDKKDFYNPAAFDLDEDKPKKTKRGRKKKNK
jgi:hypothetical protein